MSPGLHAGRYFLARGWVWWFWIVADHDSGLRLGDRWRECGGGEGHGQTVGEVPDFDPACHSDRAGLAGRVGVRLHSEGGGDAAGAGAGVGRA